MAERKVSTQKKADDAKAAKEAEEKRDEAAAEDASADESAEGGKVESAHDVLLDTGGPEGTTLEEAKEKAGDDETDEAPKKKLGENNADAAPFAGSNVAGSDEKTFGQKAQLYTDGLSGDADHNLGRAY